MKKKNKGRIGGVYNNQSVNTLPPTSVRELSRGFSSRPLVTAARLQLALNYTNNESVMTVTSFCLHLKR